jgi:hypothetical protein
VPFYDCLEKKGASNPVETSGRHAPHKNIFIYFLMVAGGCCARGKGNHQLNPNYITGFVDGEGCFHITIAKKTGNKTGYSVNLSFSIGLHSKDADLLRTIQAYFGGIGILSVTG